MNVHVFGFLKIKEQDKSSDIEQQPTFGDRKKAIHSLKIGGGGVLQKPTISW